MTKLFLSVQSGIANCHRQNKPVISALFLPAETTGFAHFSQKSDLTVILLSGSGWLSSSFPALFKALILLLNPQNVCLGMSGFPVFLSGLSPLLHFPVSFFTVLPSKRRPACCADHTGQNAFLFFSFQGNRILSGFIQNREGSC